MARKWQYSLALRSRIKLGENFSQLENSPIEFPVPPSKPQLTILIVHKNGLRFLEDTLRSIQKQTFRDYEILVIDGQSTDGSLTFLQSVPNLRVFSSPDEGLTDAFKKGVQLARGTYLTHCCVSDGYLSNNWLEVAIRSLEEQPGASLVWGFPRTLDEVGLLQDVSYPDLHWMPRLQGISQQLYLIRNVQHFPEGNLVVKTNVMRKIMDSIGRESGRHENLSYDIFLEFSFQFMKMRYLAIFLPRIANFGRIHENSLTSIDAAHGKVPVIKSRYHSQMEDLKKIYSETKSEFTFVDSEGYPTLEIRKNGVRKALIKIDLYIKITSYLRKAYGLIRKSSH